MSSGPDTSQAGSSGPGRFWFEWVVSVLLAVVVTFIYLAIDQTPSRAVVFVPFAVIGLVLGGHALHLMWRRRRIGRAS